jgi:hypothetical protein
MKAIRVLLRTAVFVFGLLGSTAASSTAGDRWFAPVLLVGTTRPDGTLGDFQWETAATPAWGTGVRAGLGAYSAGIELWTNRTTQRIDASQSALVRATRIELVAARDVAQFGANRLEARIGAGRMLLGYDPDVVTIDAGSGPVEVALAPIHTWSAGLGVGLESQLQDEWRIGLALDWRTYSLDTASREGASIVTARERFDDWSARFELTRRFPLSAIGLR